MPRRKPALEAERLAGDGRQATWQPAVAHRPQTYVRLDARGGSSSAGSGPFVPGPSTSRPNERIKGQAAGSLTPNEVVSSSFTPEVLKRPASSEPPPELQRARRARRRSNTMDKLDVVAGSRLTPVEACSVTPETRLRYGAAFEEFQLWALSLGLKVAHTDLGSLDDMLVLYLNNVLFKKGDGLPEARAALFGTIFELCLPKGPTTLPRCRRALQGFAKDQPPTSEDPVPIEAAAVIINDLLNAQGFIELLTATAFAVQFDLFTRPSETLNLLYEQVVAPKVGKYRSVAVVIAPQKPTTALHGTSTPKPAKSGEFDDTVIAGLPGLGLEWVPKVLVKLKNLAQPGQALLRPLTLGVYEATIKTAVQRLGMGHLRITPHSARHGGASTAAFLNLLDAKGIMKRGRWLSPRSVRRYEKSGKLTRQVALLDKVLVERGAAMLRPGPDFLQTKLLARMNDIKHFRKAL